MFQLIFFRALQRGMYDGPLNLLMTADAILAAALRLATAANLILRYYWFIS